MTRTYEVETTRQATASPLLRWSAVFGGVVLGSALLVLLSVLWVAFAAATEVEAIADGLGWYLAGSAVVALFVGGLLAGALSGVPSVTAGMLNGLAVWGFIVLLSTVIGTPGFLGALQLPALDLAGLEASNALWPAFWSILVAAVTAALGGALGGTVARSAGGAMRGERVERVSGRHADEREGYRERPHAERREGERQHAEQREGERPYEERPYAERREGEPAYRDRPYEERPYEERREPREAGETRTPQGRGSRPREPGAGY